MSVEDYKEIWLQPSCCVGDEGRMWCESPDFDECEEENLPTKYIRADLFKQLQAKLDRAKAKLSENLQAAVDKSNRLLNATLKELGDSRAENVQLQAENESLHKEGMTIYGIMNDKRVEQLQAGRDSDFERIRELEGYEYRNRMKNEQLQAENEKLKMVIYEYVDIYNVSSDDHEFVNELIKDVWRKNEDPS